MEFRYNNRDKSIFTLTVQNLCSLVPDLFIISGIFKGTNLKNRILGPVPLLLLVTFGLLAQSCVPKMRDVREYRAFMEPDPNWGMDKRCDDMYCHLIIDFFVSKDMEFGVKFRKDMEQQFFTVRVDFESVRNLFQFSPSKVTVRLSNGQVLKAKAFTCAYTIRDIDYLRSHPSLPDGIPLKGSRASDCFLLFFDYPGPPIEDELTIEMNEALTSNGMPTGIPLIHFRKNPEIHLGWPKPLSKPLSATISMSADLTMQQLF